MAKHTFKIWQIIGANKDFMDYAFEDFSATIKKQGGDAFPRERYTRTWLEETETYPQLDDIYERFNTDHPETYRGRSLSVSDLVEIDGELFFCDSGEWKQVRWKEAGEDE